MWHWWLTETVIKKMASRWSSPVCSLVRWCFLPRDRWWLQCYHSTTASVQAWLFPSNPYYRQSMIIATLGLVRLMPSFYRILVHLTRDAAHWLLFNHKCDLRYTESVHPYLFSAIRITIALFEKIESIAYIKQLLSSK